MGNIFYQVVSEIGLKDHVYQAFPNPALAGLDEVDKPRYELVWVNRNNTPIKDFNGWVVYKLFGTVRTTIVATLKNAGSPYVSIRWSKNEFGYLVRVGADLDVYTKDSFQILDEFLKEIGIDGAVIVYYL